MVRGIRGAITVTQNDEKEISNATSLVIEQMIERNNIDPDLVAHVLITVTEDLDATFPAKVLRLIEGWTYVPVMCAREIPVQGALEYCIRVMMTVNTDVPQKEVQHVYLNDAIKLRPDLNR
ncbi:MAG: chorismate mutase [Bacillaceae bacterium]|nr:chorismate mutase [Bacillaceae bacterium]